MSKRYEDIKFYALRLAVEEGEVRFSEVYNFAKKGGPISRKTISKILKEFVEKGQLEKIVSKVTRRMAYKATELGVKNYAIEQAFSWMESFLDRLSQETGFKMEKASFDTLANMLESFGSGLAIAFIAGLLMIRRYGEGAHEKLIATTSDCISEAYGKFLREVGLHLVKKEDFDQKIKEIVKRYYTKFEESKLELIKTKPEALRIPEISAVENELKSFLQGESAEK
jgi:DNA-binding HxlR family transcriptional regulator